MKTTKLFVGSHELHIEKRIGKGGEGEVFSISNMPGFAVKTYLPGIVAEREKKIHAMVSTRLADSAPMVAFPSQVAIDGHGKFIGFVMRLVEKHKEIHELQTPSSRQKHFPKADYAFIVRVALNIARVFTQVHATGCVVGDINQRGILVSPTATVALIDADSFQVNDGAQRYLCVVGVPEYTPPELQGKSLKNIVRTTDHDAFGLAVCLFQLLCMDRHPFSGRFTGPGEMPLEKAITEYRFAYSSRNTGMVPPPGTVSLNDFTPKVAQLFETAFSPGHVGKRPTAATWVQALGELESSLRVCSNNKLHRYARNASACPWCRMENEYGRPLFLDTDLINIRVPNGRLDPASGFVLDISAFLSVVNGVSIPSSISIPILPVHTALKPTQAANEARWKKRLNPLYRIGGIGILIAAAYAFASNVPGLLAFAIAGFGGWLVFRATSVADGLLATHRKAASAVAARIEQLQRTSPIVPLLQKKAGVLDAIDEYKQLVFAYGKIQMEYDKHRRQRQLDDHLSRFSIRGARIPKVSSDDITQLASYGITTAFDAKRRDVQQVNGIGPVKASNIAAWIRQAEARFQFQSAYSSEDQQQLQNAKNSIITKQQGIEERLKRLVAEFRQEAQSFERWKAIRDPELDWLTQQLVQAEVDLSHLGISVPVRPNITPLPVPHVSTFLRSGQPINVGPMFTAKTRSNPSPPPVQPRSVRSPAQPQAITCPQCGSRMVQRTARKGRNAGGSFWGCSRFPRCSGTRSI